MATKSSSAMPRLVLLWCLIATTALLPSLVAAYDLPKFHNERATYFKQFAYKYNVKVSVTVGEVIADGGWVNEDMGAAAGPVTMTVENGTSTSAVSIRDLVADKPLLSDAEKYFFKSIEDAFADIFNNFAEHVHYDLQMGFPKQLQYDYGTDGKGLLLRFSDFSIIQKDADKVELLSNWQAAWNTWERKKYLDYKFVIEETINGIHIESKVVYVNHGQVSDVVGKGNSSGRTYATTDASTIGQYFSQIRMKAIVLGMHNRTWVNFDFKEGYPADWHYVEIPLGNLGVGGEVLKEHQFRISSFEPGEHHPDDINKTEINWMVAGIVVVIVVGIVFTLGFFAYRFYYIRKMKKRNAAYSGDVAVGGNDSPPPIVGGPAIKAVHDQPPAEMAVMPRAAPSTAPQPPPAGAPVEQVGYGSDEEHEIEI